MSSIWHVIVAVAVAVWAWCGEHPTIAWPIAVALVSFGFDRFERRFPNVVELLRATGLDVPRAKRAAIALLRGFLERRGVVVPPDPDAAPVGLRKDKRPSDLCDAEVGGQVCYRAAGHQGAHQAVDMATRTTFTWGAEPRS